MWRQRMPPPFPYLPNSPLCAQPQTPKSWLPHPLLLATPNRSQTSKPSVTASRDCEAPPMSLPPRMTTTFTARSGYLRDCTCAHGHRAVAPYTYPQTYRLLVMAQKRLRRKRNGRNGRRFWRMWTPVANRCRKRTLGERVCRAQGLVAIDRCQRAASVQHKAM